MNASICYDNYPFWIVFCSNLVAILIYLIGAFIIYQIGFSWLMLYLAFILLLEFRLIKGHCPDCYYYGKTCAFGQGKLSGLFFKKGNTKNFCKMNLRWIDLLPDFLVSLIPIIAGIILLIMDFNWILLLLILVLFILTFSGNAVIRGRLACKHCKQRTLGCPTEKLFGKKVKK